MKVAEKVDAVERRMGSERCRVSVIGKTRRWRRRRHGRFDTQMQRQAVATVLCTSRRVRLGAVGHGFELLTDYSSIEAAFNAPLPIIRIELIQRLEANEGSDGVGCGT
jgi:hypothetical protein